jgi:hypothetical protein
MQRLNHLATRPVSKVGAPANAVLRGSGISNQGLLVRVLQEQPRGKEGPVDGPIVILDAGRNRHSQALTPFVNRSTDSQELLRVIRREHPACVNVVNANILTLAEEPALVEAAPAQG